MINPTAGSRRADAAAMMIEDGLDDILPARSYPALAAIAAGEPIPLDWSQAEAEDRANPVHEERCKKCRGSGRFISYSGRDVGPCHACKGKGRLEYKTSAEERAARREQAQARREDNTKANWSGFAEAHPAVAGWLLARAERFAFAASLKEQVEKRGSLTPAQIAAAERMLADDAARGEAQAAARRARSAEMDVSGLDAVFARARAAGAITAAIRTGVVTFSLAKATGKNPGAIYAKRPDGEYLGKITGGRFNPSLACTEADKAAVIEASQDPKAAALRYAAATDCCSICGKLLTDPVSKANRIGPKCAEKFGW